MQWDPSAGSSGGASATPRAGRDLFGSARLHVLAGSIGGLTLEAQLYGVELDGHCGGGGGGGGGDVGACNGGWW